MRANERVCVRVRESPDGRQGSPSTAAAAAAAAALFFLSCRLRCLVFLSLAFSLCERAKRERERERGVERRVYCAQGERETQEQRAKAREGARRHDNSTHSATQQAADQEACATCPGNSTRSRPALEVQRPSVSVTSLSSQQRQQSAVDEERREEGREKERLFPRSRIRERERERNGCWCLSPSLK